MNETARHRRLWGAACAVINLFLKYRFNYTYEEVPLTTPCLVVANHSCSCDGMMLAMSFRKHHLHFVTSEHLFRMGFFTRAFRYLFALIPRKKGSSGMDTAMACMRKLRAGESVCIFGEGETTWDGKTMPIFSSVGTMAKYGGASLVTYRIEGGYLSVPRWARHTRRGQVHGRAVGIYSPEELKGMSQEEIMNIINRDLAVDVWQQQKDAPVAFKGKALAENLETALFLCPKCNRLGTLCTKGDFILCSCGLNLRFTEHGFFEPATPFETIAQWDEWQLRQFDEGDYPSFSDDWVTFSQVSDDHGTTNIAHGRLMFSDGSIGVEGHRFPLDQITDMGIVRADRIIFTFEDKYYEWIAKKPRCMRKYVLAWNKAKARQTGDPTVQT